MFIRRKKNVSGTISIQIISKEPKYHVLKTIGCSKEEEKLKDLEEEAEKLISNNFDTQKSKWRNRIRQHKRNWNNNKY